LRIIIYKYGILKAQNENSVLFVFKNSMSAIHIIAGHIAIKHLAVVLLFLLNVSQSVSHHGALKLEDAGVINSRDVLFHGERVLAEIGIVLLISLADI
jgi:hypothetical protein